jgi:two-component system response regulator YesN
MYRVLLVDDEEWALVGIRKIFKWREKGFEIMGETTDSEEAFKIICEQKPDVIFTDIRMPEISGIDLIKMTRDKGLTAEFIIISGFADFSYAQEALRQGAFDYRLKPLQYDEVDGILDKLFAHLEQKSNRERMGKSAEAVSNTGDILQREQIDANENFKDLLMFIYQNYNQELYLKELSAKFFINETYCCELFRKVTGRTFSEYINSLRIKKAYDLLDTTGLTVDEVAREVGYKDYYYFNKVFKKYTGLTPFKYRRKRK